MSLRYGIVLNTRLVMINPRPTMFISHRMLAGSQHERGFVCFC